MEYTPRYLVMVTAGDNHNKYYKMIPRGSSFDVEYGRVGAGCQRRSYNINLWNAKYNEKIAKGYVDHSDLISDLIAKEKSTTKDSFRMIENRIIAEIVERLQDMAQKTVSANYTVSSSQVTMAMINEAQTVLSRLGSCESLDSFNDTLLELFSVIPRKMHDVSAYLAKDTGDFSRIVDHEQDLLDVMRGQVYVPPVVIDNNEPADDNQQTILEAHSLVFEEVDDDDIVRIKNCLGECRDKFVRAWKVTNLNTQKAFDAYVDAEKVQTRLLWHGSRNENWWSIINSGLVLRPNAVITGKMFGYGIYFATKARKSVGYTSLNGSYWAHGDSSSAFMGLYEVAYGNPYDVYSFDSKFYNMNYESLQKTCPGANCLHAHEGKMLRNDEIIVYKEDQTTIKYLVEIK